MGYVGQAPAGAGVTSADITDLAIVNADVNASAALAFSKLAALSDGNILVGSSGNVPTSVNPSGDVDVSNAGVFSIASDSVINADIKSDAAIASSKLATVAVAQGGTGATTLNDLITLATHTQGDYVQNITAGTGLTSSGATSGENIAHSLTVDASQTQITAVGDLGTGSITSGFTSIDVGSGTISTTGAVSTGALNPAGDVSIAVQKIVKLGGTTEVHDYGTDNTGYGITLTMEAGEALTRGVAVYVDSAGKAQMPDVDAASVTGKPAIGVAMTGASSGTSVNVMVLGLFRDTTAYNFSPGSPVIITGTDGALTTTAADTAADGDIVQRVGIAITADMLFVMPSIDEIEHA